MKRASIWLLAVPVLAGMLALAVVSLDRLFDWRAGKAFAKIQMGDAEPRVMMFMGSPSRVEGCPQQLRWDDSMLGANDGRCARWARYEFYHSTWSVGYSRDGKVVSKSHEVSG